MKRKRPMRTDPDSALQRIIDHSRGRGPRLRMEPKPLGGEANPADYDVHQYREKQSATLPPAWDNSGVHVAQEGTFTNDTEADQASGDVAAPKPQEHTTEKPMGRQRVEQQELIENHDHPDAKKIMKLARDCHRKKGECDEARESHNAAKEKLVQAMQAAKLPEFKSGDVYVQVKSHDPTVKIKVGDEESESGSDD